MKKKISKKQAKANKQFYESALDFSRQFVNQRFTIFTTEDIKKEFYASELPKSNPTIWGCVMRQMAKEELIFKHSTANAKNKESHQRLLQVWISKAFRLKQQANAKRESTINLFQQLEN